MLNIAVCDDDIPITGIIENYLEEMGKQYSINTDIDVFFDGLTLEHSITLGKKYDLIYLDIEMKTEDGITAAHNIRKFDPNVLIIYVSGYERYIRELFEVDAFDFISKPIDCVKFQKCFLRAYDCIINRKVYFEFQYRSENVKILLGDIIYFESKGRQIKIHIIEDKEEVFNEKLNIVEEQLSNSTMPFLRIHQSYLVNYHYIRGRSKTQIRMDNGIILPISEERQKTIGERYTSLLGGEISG